MAAGGAVLDCEISRRAGVSVDVGASVDELAKEEPEDWKRG